jgi:hypothetical protein
MSSFVTRTFVSGNDIALQTGGEEWVRPLFMGNVWTKIRIGVLVAINPISTTNLNSGYGFTIGVCSGVSAPFGAASTLNFVGVRFGDSGFGLYNANSGNPIFGFNGMSHLATKVGVTLTTGAITGSGFNYNFPVQGVGVQRRGLFYIDIAKGSPSYTVDTWHVWATATGGAHDYTVPELLLGMPQIGAITTAGFSLNQTSNTITASELAGPFDTVDIYTNLPGYPGETYEVAIQKLA